MCSKIVFGYRHAHEIVSACHKSYSTHYHKKIPQRVYYCQECHAWHLTSEKSYKSHLSVKD